LQDNRRQLDNSNRTGGEKSEGKGTTRPDTSKSGDSTPPKPRPPQ
jgi:hypothetical protein